MTDEEILERAEKNILAQVIDEPKIEMEKELELNDLILYFLDKNKYSMTKRYSHRSLGDTFYFCRHYYPELRLNDLIESLFTLVKEGRVGTFICGDIRKRVWWVKNTLPGMIEKPEVESFPGDEYDIDYTDRINRFDLYHNFRNHSPGIKNHIKRLTYGHDRGEGYLNKLV